MTNQYRVPGLQESTEILLTRQRATAARNTITAILTGFGLKAGPNHDFTVHQVKQRGKVTGVRVYLQNQNAEKMAYLMDTTIQLHSSQRGFPFRVVTQTTRSGQHLSDISWEV